MITCRTRDSSYEFEISAEPPLIYLDHWALRRLSENPALGDRFLDAFVRRGTVMFSLMNVSEVARDASPDRAWQIRAFLERLGPHWVPMTIDPLRIIEAEETGTVADGTHPCVSVGFLTDPAFATRLATGPVSLAHVVDLTRRPDGDELIQVTDRNTDVLRRAFRNGEMRTLQTRATLTKYIRVSRSMTRSPCVESTTRWRVSRSRTPSRSTATMLGISFTRLRPCGAPKW